MPLNDLPGAWCWSGSLSGLYCGLPGPPRAGWFSFWPATGADSYSRPWVFSGVVTKVALLQIQQPNPARLLVEVEHMGCSSNVQMTYTIWQSVCPWQTGISKAVNSGAFYHRETNWGLRVEFREYLVVHRWSLGGSFTYLTFFSTLPLPGQCSEHWGFNSVQDSL